MLRTAFTIVDAIIPAGVDRLLAHAFSRPRRKSRGSDSAPDPLRLVCSRNRHPSGCAIWAAGDGPTVLLVHGWEASHRDMDPFARLLLSNGYRVLAIDLPAHGATGGRSATIPQLSDAIREVIERPIGSPIGAVIAHSLGGAAAVRAVASSSHSIPMALIASPSRARDYLQRMIVRFGLAPERIIPILRRYESIHGVDLEAIDAAVDAPAISEEVLLIYGGSDRLVPPSEGERYEALLSRTDLHILPALGHRGVLRDENVRQLVLDFVQRATARRHPRGTERINPEQMKEYEI